ncbi:hypothetical protein GCM10027299_42390 [Larkinella ripae]
MEIEFGRKLALPVKIYCNGIFKGVISSYGDGQLNDGKPYPASMVLVVRLPRHTTFKYAVLDKDGYYYEHKLDQTRAFVGEVILKNISPESYWWKLKYIPQ